MSETKTYVFPEGGAFGGNNAEGVLLGSMMNGGGYGGGMWNNPIWAIVFLAALRNGGIFGDNNGNGGRCQLSQIQEQLQTIQGNNSLMAAITGGTSEIRSLANTINCDVNAVTAAINVVQSQLANVGNQVGMSSSQIVNAIQSGNTALANQISQCCCQAQQQIITQGYETRINNLQQSQLISNGFSQLGYTNAENTSKVIAKLDQIEDARKDREISTLTAQLATVNARAERQAELAPLYKAVNDIQCKLPNTVSVPYPQLTAVPNYLLYGGAFAAGAAAGVFGVGGAGVLG